MEASLRQDKQQIQIRAKEPLSKKKRITVIHTGGTIGGELKTVDRHLKMTHDWGNGVSELVAQKLPLFHQYELNYSTPFSILSEKLIPRDWSDIARSIEFAIHSGVDGIVVTHGTDTMAFSTAAISFMLRNLPIPVVFTGALRPLSDKRSDAMTNLVDSIIVADYDKLKGVYVVFPNDRGLNTIFQGNRIGQIQPFGKSFEHLPNSILGHVVNGKVKLTRDDVSSHDVRNGLVVKREVCEKVAFFHLYPGFDPWYLKTAIDRDIKAILLYLYHSGTACTREIAGKTYSIASAIHDISLKEVLVFIMPKPILKERKYIYPTSREVINAGGIPLPRMTWEVSLVKLMWALGQTNDNHEIKAIMTSDLAGETFRTSEINHLNNNPVWR